MKLFNKQDFKYLFVFLVGIFVSIIFFTSFGNILIDQTDYDYLTSTLSASMEYNEKLFKTNQAMVNDVQKYCPNVKINFIE